MSVERLKARPLSDRLVDAVRDIILSGRIPSDEPIRQDALAAELNVSKIPLREALARLVQDGLVVAYPNRGFFVRAMSLAEAEDIFALRLKLEPDAAASACAKADEAARVLARDALARFDAAAAAHAPSVGALNRAFHLALIAPGAGEVTLNILSRLHVMADRYVRKHLEPLGRERAAEHEHHDILGAWCEGDAPRVRALVAEHLEHTLKDLRAELTSRDHAAM
jgi:DNA-binding GntR family transcriptional regulator